MPPDSGRVTGERRPPAGPHCAVSAPGLVRRQLRSSATSARLPHLSPREHPLAGRAVGRSAGQRDHSRKPGRRSGVWFRTHRLPRGPRVQRALRLRTLLQLDSDVSAIYHRGAALRALVGCGYGQPWVRHLLWPPTPVRRLGLDLPHGPPRSTPRTRGRSPGTDSSNTDRAPCWPQPFPGALPPTRAGPTGPPGPRTSTNLKPAINPR
jgi:hypothetical protein